MYLYIYTTVRRKSERVMPSRLEAYCKKLRNTESCTKTHILFRIVFYVLSYCVFQPNDGNCRTVRGISSNILCVSVLAQTLMTS